MAAKIRLNDITFKEKEHVIFATFLNRFYFLIDKEKLRNIGPYILKNDIIEFEGINETEAKKKLNNLILQGYENLKNINNHKKTVYIHSDSGIPLIGNTFIGLIDRDMNIIEVKPITGCNLNCIYCSVSEDLRTCDFVVEEAYLAREFKKLVEYKGITEIEAHIASEGEPLLFAHLKDLIRDISSLPMVSVVSIDTNGALLTPRIVDELVNAGLTRFNLSINAMDGKLAQQIAGTKYNIQNIIDIARYISKKAELLITPVMIPEINENEIPKIIQFSKSINAGIAIQNFLNYPSGKNPIKGVSFNLFFEKLKKWQEEYQVKLIMTAEDFSVKKTEPLPLPFHVGDVIDADVACPGRFRDERIAVSKGRSITVTRCNKKGKIKIKITNTKFNNFKGELT